MATVSPEEVLAALKTGAHPRKQLHLDVVHAVCQEIHRLGSNDFSIASIGRMAAQRGGPAFRTLYNPQSEHFRTLIKAWSDFTGDVRGKSQPVTTPLAEEDLLRKIEDPALRALIRVIVAERNHLRADLNTLRANSTITLDMRPLPGEVRIGEGGDVTQVCTTKHRLLPHQRIALERAIAPKFLAQEGWSEGEHGEILNAKGRRLFEKGFVTAVRLILEE
jgi:hypothetical protein